MAATSSGVGSAASPAISLPETYDMPENKLKSPYRSNDSKSGAVARTISQLETLQVMHRLIVLHRTGFKRLQMIKTIWLEVQQVGAAAALHRLSHRR